MPAKSVKENIKELKDKETKEVKDKDHKEFKEKDHKEFKELKEKEFKEVKEKEFKEVKEKDHKEFKELEKPQKETFENPLPADPVQSPPVDVDALKQRIERLEKHVGLGTPFISTEERPAVGQGALRQSDTPQADKKDE